MPTPSDKRGPDPSSETPTAAPAAVWQALEHALVGRHGERLAAGENLEVMAWFGGGAVHLGCAVGTARRCHELQVFARGSTAGSGPIAERTLEQLLATPLGALVDYLDGLLEEVVGQDDRYLPLDWEGRPFEGSIVFVKGEVRDLVAEEEAARLLEEAPPARLIPRR